MESVKKFSVFTIAAIFIAVALATAGAPAAAAEEKKAKKSAAETKKPGKAAKEANPELEKEMKALYDQKMIDAVKLFSSKKDKFDKKTRSEIEDVMTIAANQARLGYYGDALLVLDELESILSGSKKQSDTIVLQDEASGQVKSYKFDINKENVVVSSSDKSEDAPEKAADEKSEEVTPTTAPDGKFNIKRLTVEEQTLYNDLIKAVAVAEYEAGKHQNPENAQRLMRLRRAFYTLKKKGMGYPVDDELIKELAGERASAKKSKKSDKSK